MSQPKPNPKEVQVERIKEEIQQELNTYFADLQSGLATRTIKIDDIERMLKEKKETIDQKLRDATGDVISEKTTATEKNDVQNAIKPCENKRKHQA